MGIEDMIIWTLVNLVVVVTLAVCLKLAAGLFVVFADCLPVNFDPVCYSASANPGTSPDDPKWWPHGGKEPPAGAD